MVVTSQSLQIQETNGDLVAWYQLGWSGSRNRTFNRPVARDHTCRLHTSWWESSLLHSKEPPLPGKLYDSFSFHESQQSRKSKIVKKKKLISVFQSNNFLHFQAGPTCASNRPMGWSSKFPWQDTARSAQDNPWREAHPTGKLEAPPFCCCRPKNNLRSSGKLDCLRTKLDPRNAGKLQLNFGRGGLHLCWRAPNLLAEKPKRKYIKGKIHWLWPSSSVL